MPLIKDGRLAEDRWVELDDAAEIAPGDRAIVSLERWQVDREALLQRNTPIGIRLKSDQSPALIAEDVTRFAMIALEFPKFTDGRAYSSARLLRERYGFEGELRAVGNVLRDQFLFMTRCGFDAFEVADAKAAENWLAATAEISVRYQPATDGQPSALALRRQRAAQAKPEKPRNRAQGRKESKRRVTSATASVVSAPAALSCAAHWAY